MYHFVNSSAHNNQWRIEDFSLGRAPTMLEGAPTSPRCVDFSTNLYVKIKQIGTRWREHAPAAAPPGSATDNDTLNSKNSKITDTKVHKMIRTVR